MRKIIFQRHDLDFERKNGEYKLVVKPRMKCHYVNEKDFNSLFISRRSYGLFFNFQKHGGQMESIKMVGIEKEGLFNYIEKDESKNEVRKFIENFERELLKCIHINLLEAFVSENKAIYIDLSEIFKKMKVDVDSHLSNLMKEIFDNEKKLYKTIC